MTQNHCLNFLEKANVEAKGKGTWLGALLSCPQRIEALNEVTGKSSF